MATEVTLNLPDNTYHHAARLAQLLNQDVTRVLVKTIESALSPLGATTLRFTPVEELDDNGLLAAADLRMDERQGRRLGVLLDRQQSAESDEPEQRGLAALMQVYHEQLVCKAQALREAVRRGLREPLEP